jgi:hypothetical protein
MKSYRVVVYNAKQKYSMTTQLIETIFESSYGFVETDLNLIIETVSKFSDILPNKSFDNNKSGDIFFLMFCSAVR